MPLGWDGILDGELLAYRDGTVLPFQSLQARLGRKSPSAAIRAEVPVIFVAFDLLGLGDPDGGRIEALLREPLDERRRRLDALDLPLGRRRRRVRPIAPQPGRLGRRPRDGVHRGPRPAERGPDGQGPDERLLARAGAGSAG